MKKFMIMALAIVGLFVQSCKKDKAENNISETEGLMKVQEISNSDYTVEVYTTSGILQLGYNEVYLRLKEKSTGDYKQDVNFSWMPVMNMTSMEHACPKSDISKVPGKQTLYKGYLVFQMPENSSEHWQLSVDYSSGSVTGSVSDQISVHTTALKNVTVFTGADSKTYVLALVQPQKPVVAINDLTLALFSMESMMMFPIVANYTIELDPRMPDMGNHSSPNNENPVFSAADNFYHGKLSLTMTGNWKLNLIVKNANGDTLKGEPVSGTTDSSLYLEVEAQ